MGWIGFIVTTFTLGFFMSLGKAAVFKHIPVYYPNHVGAVGGLVGMIGGLGGFFLPIVTFGALLDLTGIWHLVLHALLFVSADCAGLDASVDPRYGARRAWRGAGPPAAACPRCRTSTTRPDSP
jgi:nitrate/nitrite transporter NarK